MDCLPLWPTYKGEKGRTLGKTYGIKARMLWGTHWEPMEHIGNLKGNMLGQRKNEKKSRHFEFMLSLPIGCMFTIFGLG
jgi:hypothetical protein